MFDRERWNSSGPYKRPTWENDVAVRCCSMWQPTDIAISFALKER